MSTYTVAHAKHATLGAATVDTINFTTRHYVVTITNLTAATVIYGTLSGADPTVGGDDTFVVLPGAPRELDFIGGGISQVKLISSGTPEYNVEARL